jgi:hypothetical protein
VRLSQSAFSLQVKGYLENGFNFLFCEVKIANHVAAA